MDTEKAWEEFQANDSSIRKSESVQQDIQQILDTVTQIKTDVDQLKADGPKATGPADEEPTLSAPTEEQQPSPEMGGGADLPSEPEPQNAPGDLMPQPEDGAATPSPEPMEPPMEPPMPEPTMPAQQPYDYTQGLDTDSDEDIIMDAARDVKDPEVKKQLLALAYQYIEARNAPLPPIAPPMMEEPAPEEILAEAADVNGDGMVSEEEAEELFKSKSFSEANPAKDILGKSDDEEKDDDKKEDDDKKDEGEPGVTDIPESKDEDKDSSEEQPVVTEVKVEEEIPEPESPESEKEEAIDSIIDSILDDAKDRIKEQVVMAVDGIDDAASFTLSTKDMMNARFGKDLESGFKRSIQWPESFKGVSTEDKCRFFARSFNSMDAETQDKVIGLMDYKLGADRTDSIFKSEGVDLGTIYKSQDGVQATKNVQASSAVTDAVAGENASSIASSDDAPIAECNDAPVKECNDGPVKESEIKKSYQAGKHIPTVSEMMAFKKSGQAYMGMPRDMAESHSIVSMEESTEIPSTRELFAKYNKR